MLRLNILKFYNLRLIETLITILVTMPVALALLIPYLNGCPWSIVDNANVFCTIPGVSLNNMLLIVVSWSIFNILWEDHC